MEGDDKFADRYRIESTRLPGWNYGDDGWYFVTVCVKDRECYFGDVVDGQMVLSLIGQIVEQELLKTVAIRENVRIDIYQIMPNHVHVIFVIDNSVETAAARRLVESNQTSMSDGGIETPIATNETPQRGRLYNNERGEPHPWHKNEWQSNTLGSIINQFKSVCTKRIRKINPSFA